MFELNEEQRAFQDVAQAFARDHLSPFAAEWDAKSFFPVDTMRKAAELGFASLYVREDVGGTNLTRLDASLILDRKSVV